MKSTDNRFIDIVFSEDPEKGPDLTFVEVESPPGTSISFGEWVRRDDGYLVLRIDQTALSPITGTV